jgi:hypothetical protein
MFATATLGDWTMFTGIMTTLATLTAVGYRWVLAETNAESQAMPVDLTRDNDRSRSVA